MNYWTNPVISWMNDHTGDTNKKGRTLLNAAVFS